MPELPEVETSRRGIEPHLVGATILHAVVRNGRLRWPVSEEIYRLSDQPVLSVQRRAKYLLLELPEGWIIIHLGMSGSLRILPEELPPEKHDHVDLVMSNGKVLRYTDPRRFGAWLWTKELEGQYRVWTCLPYEDTRLVEVYRIEVEPGGVYVSGSHGEKTREYLAVTEGELTVECHGQSYCIHKDQIFKFETDQEHVYKNTGSEKACCTCFFLDYHGK
mgnify:FL=1